MVAEYQVSSRDIFEPHRLQKRPRPPAKLRDPETGVTWSDRGREPAWITGRDHTAFLINSHAK
ncbi:H-NS family nucleoid-associated regulatory protein [Burkholderia sp.]|uniref:H-NS family nucleoid-associated regulatory protein n=1 Tax=Burkholderia sp. TaxID=36773 RepID=UPI0035E362C2